MRKWLEYARKSGLFYMVPLFTVALFGLWQCMAWQQEGQLASVEQELQELQELLVFQENLDEMLADDELPDFSAFEDVNQRKAAFFSYLNPYVDRENERVLQLRQALEPIWEAVETGKGVLTEFEAETLESVAEQYGLDPEKMDRDEMVAEMRLRVDVIPKSLVLAQAANESAWGTSRFAREGNNLFGQWCFSEGCGLVPQRRVPGATHEVRSFDTVADAVYAYFRNINTNSNYAFLRELRADMREHEQPLNALVLAHGLTQYSERGFDYVNEVQSIIRFNGLAALDEPA